MCHINLIIILNNLFFKKRILILRAALQINVNYFLETKSKERERMEEREMGICAIN
jgi:hypothetical protein